MLGGNLRMNIKYYTLISDIYAAFLQPSRAEWSYNSGPSLWLYSMLIFCLGVVQWEKPSTNICFEESVAISLFHYLSRKKPEHFKTIKVTALNTLPNHDLRSAIRPYIREGEEKTNGEITGSGPPVEIMVRGVILARKLGKTSHIHTSLHPSPQEKIRQYEANIFPPFPKVRALTATLCRLDH